MKDSKAARDGAGVMGGFFQALALEPTFLIRDSMSVPAITDTRQYLTFQLGEEVFALDVSHVREILKFTTVTKVPKTPDYMRGVIKLMGAWCMFST